MSQKSLLIILVQTLHIMRVENEFDAKMSELKILVETNLHELK